MDSSNNELKKSLAFACTLISAFLCFPILFQGIIKNNEFNTLVAALLAIILSLCCFAASFNILMRICLKAPNISHKLKNFIRVATSEFKCYVSNFGVIRTKLVVSGWVIVIIGAIVHILGDLDSIELGTIGFYCWFILKSIYAIKLNLFTEFFIFLFISSLFALGYKLTKQEHDFNKKPISELSPILVGRAWANYLTFCSVRIVIVSVCGIIWFCYTGMIG